MSENNGKYLKNTQENTKRGRGRPRKHVDFEKMNFYAKIGCTIKEIAVKCGISEDTIERNYAGFIADSRNEGLTEIRHVLWSQAIRDKSFPALKMLAEQFLGYVQKQQQINLTTNVAVNVEARNEREERMAGILKDLIGRRSPASGN